MTVYPNVKLNLGLWVLGSRPDGFHNIETVFVPYFGFCDCLEIVPSKSFDLKLMGPHYHGWDPSEDLCARAWRLLRADFGIDPVHIVLEKNSPVGAGLGGGSADAAFTLMALNDIFSLGLSHKQMASYAAMLGSDCAFFIYNSPQFASGRGEVLESIHLPLDAYRFEVAIPQGIRVSTKEAYGNLPKELSHTTVSLKDILLSTPPTNWREIVENDFEQSVFRPFPELAALKQSFYDKGAVYASMSGSGSAVFGMFKK